MSEEKEVKSSIPNFPDMVAQASQDSVTTAFGAFRNSITITSSDESYGGDITNTNRRDYADREPVVKWFIYDVADDIWDNWFSVRDVDDKDSDDLDKAVQKVLNQLKAKIFLPRSTKFERLYGTSIMVLSFSGDTDWESPAYDYNPLTGKITMSDGVDQLLQVTPYPWTNVSSVDVVSDENDLRYGLPEYYYVNRTFTGGVEAPVKIERPIDVPGSITVGQGTPSGEPVKIHWTRVIHDVVELREHPYEGVSRVDIIFDDAVGYRNSKWGQYSTIYRYGSGFPVFFTQGTKEENEAWIDSGEIERIMSRSYFVCGPDENLEFRGTQAQALNPTPYNDMFYTNVAAGTRIAQDTLKGVSAGRVTGSEVNERQYFKFISLQQNKKEPASIVPLLNILMATGQIVFSGEYYIDWVNAFEVNPQDRVAMEFMTSRMLVMDMSYMTLDEVRAKAGLPPIGGDIGSMILGAQVQAKLGMPVQTEEPDQPSNLTTPSTEEPEPEEQPTTEGRLMDKALGMAMWGTSP